MIKLKPMLNPFAPVKLTIFKKRWESKNQSAVN